MMSIAAGETDYEVDRVACFETTCTAFGSIIFDLDKNSGFNEFLAACEKTSQFLKDDEHIIQKLVSFLFS